MVGAGKHWPTTHVVGISVSRDRAWFQERVATMASDCADLLGWDMCFLPQDIWVGDGYVGPGYGQPSSGSIQAIHRTAERKACCRIQLIPEKPWMACLRRWPAERYRRVRGCCLRIVAAAPRSIRLRGYWFNTN